MQSDPQDHTLEFLLDFDGRVHWLASGHRLKFKIRRVDYSPNRPHGLRYSFTLHDPKGRRLIGFDNAHHPSQRAGAAIAKPAAKDHWHRTRSEAGVPYAFRDAETLLADFFREVGRVLAEAGVSDDVVRVEER